MQFRARWHNGVLRLLTNQPPELREGETVEVEIKRERSGKSHRHLMASVTDAWENLPEHLAGMPWAASPDTLRKFCLIRAGFCNVETITCDSKATAARVAVYAKRKEDAEHGFSIVDVRGATVAIYTPHSQRYAAMDSEAFKASKEGILRVLAELLGVKPEDLKRDAA